MRAGGFLGADDADVVRAQHLLRTVAQPFAWAVGLDLIERAERADGARHDWVIRARPGAWWFLPHPSACALRPSTIYLHDWLDMAFALPRDAAPLVLRGLRDEYSACAGVFKHNSLEEWVGNAAWNRARSATAAPQMYRR